MTNLVFVRDSEGRPLMPMSPAYARKLLRRGKARIYPHYTFTILELLQPVPDPQLRQVVLVVAIHQYTAELFLLAEGTERVHPLMYVLIDLWTDLSRRLRRRAGHRRRRRSRGRYRAARRQSIPFKMRRPSVAHSQWAGLLRRTEHQRSTYRRSLLSPLIRWRAQVINRVISKIRQLLPVTDLVILSPLNKQQASTETSADRGRGALDRRSARPRKCAYCGSQKKIMELDHMIPQSRGGTSFKHNLVMACRRCNAQKGAQDPTHIGLSNVPGQQPPQSFPRAVPYTRQTAYLLMNKIQQTGIRVYWKHHPDDQISTISLELQDVLYRMVKHLPESKYVAKPISHGRKQVFTATNYPLSTSLRAQYTRVGTTVKRRVRVNQALAIQNRGKQKVRVISVEEEIPDDAEQIILPGMLCQGIRASKAITGIVNAIHTAGRITLLVLDSAQPKRIYWKRVVISPRQQLRIRTKDKIIFIPL